MNEIKRIGIVGIGGVGGYYGGQLAAYYQNKPDYHLTFIARGKHLEAIQQHGLRVKTDAKTFSCNPDVATADLQALREHDLIILCIKGYDLASIAQSLKTIVTTNTLILPLLNGVSSSDYLRSTLERGMILDGCVYVNSYISASGEVTQYGAFDKMVFGHKNQHYSDQLSAIENLMLAAGIKAKYEKQILEKVWSKYVLISAMASVTSAKNKPIGILMEGTHTQQLLLGVMKEVVALAKAKGIALADDLVEITFEHFKKFDYHAKSSMLLDFEKGKQTELELLTGYVVNESAALGLTTPVTTGLYKVLQKKG